VRTISYTYDSAGNRISWTDNENFEYYLESANDTITRILNEPKTTVSQGIAS
jgi:hypothetical protein